MEIFFKKNPLLNNIKKGIVILSRVLEINKKFVVVDCNIKSESYINIKEFYDNKKNINIKVGDFIETILIKLDNGFGYTVVSRSLFFKYYIWRFIKFIFKNKIKIKCDFLNKFKNGISFNFKGLKCFLPINNLDKNLFIKFNYELNKNLYYRIYSFNFYKKSIILSRNLVIKNIIDFKKKLFFLKLKKGFIIKGIVKIINLNGVFVSFGYYDGFIPINYIKRKYKKHPNEILSINQSVLVKILKKDFKNRIILNLLYFKKSFLNFFLNLKIYHKLILRIRKISNNFIKVVFSNNLFGYINISSLNRKKIFYNLLNKLKINFFIEIFIKKLKKNRIKFKILKIFNPSLAQ